MGKKQKTKINERISKSQKVNVKLLKDILFFRSLEKEISPDFSHIIGVDEAGRGPWFGEVFVAACIIPNHVHIDGLNDSKQLSEKKREEMYEKIISHPDIKYHIVSKSSTEIDQSNILQVTMDGMTEAVEKILPQNTENKYYLLFDGNKIPEKMKNIPNTEAMAIVQGDAKAQSIAAASILAKVSRDRLMEKYQLEYPQYDLKSHKGYGTKKHLDELQKFGPCPLHRMSFKPLKNLVVRK